MISSKKNVKPNSRCFLTPEQVDACFEQAKDQVDYVLALYRLVFPDFDQLQSVDGFPTMGDSLSQYIWQKALLFDTEHHPQCMPGGCWLNHGFRTDMSFPPWGVEQCPVTYKECAV